MNCVRCGHGEKAHYFGTNCVRCKCHEYQAPAGVAHWTDGDGKRWHAVNQAGNGHPADPAHKFQVVDMPCDCVRGE